MDRTTRAYTLLLYDIVLNYAFGSACFRTAVIDIILEVYKRFSSTTYIT